MPKIHALLPRLISELGHILHYHRSVQKAAESMGWNYFAYVPKKTKVFPLPSGWQPVLANDILEKPKNLFEQFIVCLSNLFSFKKIFKRIEKDPQSIIFIEHFEVQHLLSILLALLFLKPKFKFWILFRYEMSGRKAKIWVYRIFINFLFRKFGKGNIKFLTDSDLLKKSISEDLKIDIDVVPIPHTEQRDPKNKNQKENLFWWPGGLIREDKGLSKISYLLSLIEKKDPIRIIAAEKAKENFKDSWGIQYIPTFLARKDYIDWMQRANLILLPYSGQDYSLRTSGIFVEAITLGAIPVTAENTWMAYELKKYDLSELVLSWNQKNLIKDLIAITENPSIQQKLTKMQRNYQNFHSEKGFSRSLKMLMH